MLKKPTSFWGSLFGTSKRYSIEDLHQLYGVLVKNPFVNESNRAQVVETIRSIAELMIWGDQNEPRVFEYFLENNVMVYLHKVLLQSGNRRGDVAKQVLQTLGIIIQNVKSETATGFLFSNNHINNIVQIEFDFDDEEVLGYYISFLKTISLKLNPLTVQFFIDSQPDGERFPLYSEAIKFAHHKDAMVRAAVRTLTLNVYCVKDKGIEEFVTSDEAIPYYSHMAKYLSDQIQELDRRMLSVEVGQTVNAISALDSQLAEVEDVISYCSDVMSNGPERVAQMLAEQLWITLAGPHLLWPILDHIPVASTYTDERASHAPKSASGSPGIGQTDGSGVFAHGSPARPAVLQHVLSRIAEGQQRAAVRAACSVFVLERLFQVLTYTPLLHHLAIMLLAVLPTAGGTQPPQEQQDAAPMTLSCRPKLLDMMAAADVRCAAAVLRMLVALVQNRHISTELLHLLGLLPSTPGGVGLHTHGNEGGAAHSCRACIWEGWLERIAPRLCTALQEGGMAFPDVLEELTMLASSLDTAGPGPLDPRSRVVSRPVTALPRMVNTPSVTSVASMAASETSVAESEEAAMAHLKKVALVDAGSFVSDTSTTDGAEYYVTGVSAKTLAGIHPRATPIYADPLGAVPLPPVESDEEAEGTAAAAAAAALGVPASEAASQTATPSLAVPAGEATSQAGTQGTVAAPESPQELPSAGPTHRTPEDQEAADASTADAVVDDLIGRLASVDSTAVATAADAADATGSADAAAAGSAAAAGGAANAFRGAVAAAAEAAGSSDAQAGAGEVVQGRVGSTIGSEELLAAAAAGLDPEDGEQDLRPDGTGPTGEAAGSSGRSEANQAGVELAGALLRMLVVQLVPSCTLCHIGWLLKQLLPHGSEEGSCSLSSAQASLLALAQGQAQTALLEELGRMWCEAIFPLICLEWAVCREGMTRPLLRASCDVLLTGPQAYPLVQPKPPSRTEAGLSGSAMAALRTYHATQRLVTLIQMGQLLSTGTILQAPPTPAINDVELRANDIAEGFQVDLAPGTAIPTVVSFAPGQEKRVYFAVAGVSGRQRSSEADGQGAPPSTVELLHSPPVVVLTDPVPSRANAGVVLSVAPLMGASPSTDPKMASWLHVHVRPSVRGLLRVLKAAVQKKGGLLTAVRQLADGHWVLAFPDAERSRSAQVLVEQHASRLRSVYINLLSPVLSTELPL